MIELREAGIPPAIINTPSCLLHQEEVWSVIWEDFASGALVHDLWHLYLDPR